MKITKKWLESKDACTEGIKWFEKRTNTDLITLLNDLQNEDHWTWANWLIIRCMNYKQRISYAIFAAEQVIHIYEKKYPDDNRPRNAIEAAKKCLKNPSKKNKDAAADAAYADAAAADAAVAAAYAAYAAADAADAAYADAAADAAVAAYAAADAAADAAVAAYAAADAAADAAVATARLKIRKLILDYGISLLKK